MNALLRIAKIVCFLFLVSLPCMVNSQSESNENWWEDNSIVVKGHGLPPENISNMPQARAWTRREALENAKRQMAEQINSIHITAGKTVHDEIISGDIMESQVEAVIREAKILSEEYYADGNCIIVMTLPIYGGKDSVASLIFKPVEKEDFPKPTKSKNKAKGNYTGLIIDCGDLELNPVLAPSIHNANNQSIYSYDNLDYEKVIANGMISYAKEDKQQGDDKPLLLTLGKLNLNSFIFNSACAAKNNKSRAGDNPLVVKAKVVSDGNSTPVVSIDDADKILIENQASHFLDEGAVVFTGYKVGGIRI